jgi:mono/diheme cytochrome c family protein
MILLAACSPPAQKPAPADVLAKGGEVYDMMCAQCHLDGSGSETAPPLIGSAAVAGDPSAVIAIILNGRKGQSLVGGKPFNGIMPAQGTMPDADIAAVTAYIRKQFANRDEDIPVPLVTSLRPAQSH